MLQKAVVQWEIFSCGNASIMGAGRGGAWKIPKNVLGYIGGLFTIFSSCGGLSATFFSLWRALFTMLGPFRYFFLHGGSLFWACHIPLRKFLGAHMASNIVGSAQINGHLPRAIIHVVQLCCHEVRTMLFRKN